MNTNTTTTHKGFGRKVKKTAVLCAALSLASVLLTACGGTRENDPIIVSQLTLDMATEDAVNTSILSAVNTFADEADAFDDAVRDFCILPQQETLTSLQQQWLDLNTAWYRLAPYKFGPLEDDVVFPAYIYIDSLRLRGTNYLATVREEIVALMTSDIELNTSFFSGKTFQRQGLLALEVALFETASNYQTPNSTNNLHIVEEYFNNNRKCDIINGWSQLLQTRADYIQSGWTDTFKNSSQSYRDLFISKQLDDGAEPISVLLVAAQEHLDYLKQRNVVTTAAQVSDSVWQAVEASILEIEQLINGTEASRVSFIELMTSAGHTSSVETVNENIAAIKMAIQNKDANLFNVNVALLDGNFKREIPKGLEIELGLNFTDGD